MPSNIIVFFTDDHAQWALPAYGNREIHAPNLTHLAQSGVLMQNAFTPCPVCSPARASFWTGLYPSQHGVHDHLAEDSADVQATDWLAGMTTLAQRLQSAGYTTALTGKWHCGAGEIPKPGFDFWHSAWRKTPKYDSPINRYSDQGAVVERRGTDTQIITDAAVDFLRARDRDAPFFLFVGYAATHNPWINRPERLVTGYRLARFNDIPVEAAWPFGGAGSHPLAPADPREARAQYYASVSMIDEGVGRLLDELEAQRARAETLIVYTSDHGLNLGQHGIWGKGNGSEPLNMLEESIRVPLILNQPGVVESGQARAEFVTHCDLHQTLLDFAGVAPVADAELPQLPGRSFKPMLPGEPAADWQNIYIGEYGPVRAIRDRRYKLVRRAEGDLLHDLDADPRETVNQIDEADCRPVAARLSAQLDAFFARYEVAAYSGKRGDALPIHNRHEAWRAADQSQIDP
ncbi:MAG: sulfatase-like hydrolase/transferase [Chloroflexi bacterium]|nr:sulfatase-like hydrolase/transferase [Chloroflexota bacterium]